MSDFGSRKGSIERPASGSCSQNKGRLSKPGNSITAGMLTILNNQDGPMLDQFPTGNKESETLVDDLVDDAYDLNLNNKGGSSSLQKFNANESFISSSRMSNPSSIVSQARSYLSDIEIESDGVSDICSIRSMDRYSRISDRHSKMNKMIKRGQPTRNHSHLSQQSNRKSSLEVARPNMTVVTAPAIEEEEQDENLRTNVRHIW